MEHTQNLIESLIDLAALAGEKLREDMTSETISTPAAIQAISRLTRTTLALAEAQESASAAPQAPAKSTAPRESTGEREFPSPEYRKLATEAMQMKYRDLQAQNPELARKWRQSEDVQVVAREWNLAGLKLPD